MKKRILAISLSVAVLLVSLTVAGMLTVSADTTINWQNPAGGDFSKGQAASVASGTYNLADNLLTQAGVKAYATSNSTEATINAKLIDGKLPGDAGFSGYTKTINPGGWYQLYVDLGGVTTIDRFLVAGGSNIHLAWVRVFCSVDDNTVAPANGAVEVTRSASSMKGAYWLRPTETVKARYVRFMVYSPRNWNDATDVANGRQAACTGYDNGTGKWGSYQIELGEFGVFGTKVIKGVENAATTVKTYDALSDGMKYTIDNNILKGMAPTQALNAAGTFKPVTGYAGLTDGNVFNGNVEIAFGDDASTAAKRAVWYQYELGQTMEISSVLVAAGKNNGIEAFSVYVINDATTAENLAKNPSARTPAYTSNKKLGTNDSTWWPQNPEASAVLVEFGELQVGQRIIFKFQTCNNSGYTKGALSEIAAVGGVAPIENKGAQIRANDGTVADLRFVFELNASGVAYGEGVYRAIADDAKVCLNGKLYTLKGYGAIVSLDGDAIKADAPLTNEAVKEVEAEKLYEVKTENKEVIYTVVVTDVPNFDEKIYARAYVDYQNGDDVVRVYDEVQVKTVNGVEAKAAEDAEAAEAAEAAAAEA